MDWNRSNQTKKSLKITEMYIFLLQNEEEFNIGRSMNLFLSTIVSVKGKFEQKIEIESRL